MPTPEWISGEPETLLPIEAVPDEAALDTAYEPGEPDGTRKRRHIGGFSGLGAITLALACSGDAKSHEHPELAGRVTALEQTDGQHGQQLEKLKKGMAAMQAANDALKAELAAAKTDVRQAAEEEEAEQAKETAKIAITEAVNKKFGTDLQTLVFRTMIIEGILEIITSEWKTEGLSYLADKAAGTGTARALKINALAWASKDGGKLPKWAGDFADIVTALPTEMQATLLAELRVLVASYAEAAPLYAKYKKLLDHHDAWLEHYWKTREAQRNKTTPPPPFNDSCANEPLHTTYQEDVATDVKFVILMMRDLEKAGIGLSWLTKAVQALKQRFSM